MATMEDRPLCLLALDGGGIRGLSELVVLEEIMNRIQYDLDVDVDPIPADFFDLIGGTSTGGLIALLLGRLHLSVPQARREYVRIAEEVFCLPRYFTKNTFSGEKLEEAVKRLLGKDHSEEKMLQKDGSCKVFVCAVPQKDIKARAGPRLFRTYRVRENSSFNCKIWEACRATSAAPSYFEPIKIGDQGEQETFVDGGLGYNNPVEQVLEEARRIFPGRKVACVVSIGTGVASVISFPDSPKTSLVKLITALQSMATESDTTAEKVHARFKNVKDTYFRFSVDRGLQDIGLEEWKELSKVRTFTTEYLHQHLISEQVNKVVWALLAAKIVDQEGPGTVIQLPKLVAGGIESSQESQESPRALEWRPAEGTLPSFHYTTEKLASHIVVSTLSRRHWVVPFDRNPDFVGRSTEVKQLLAKIPPRASKDNCQLTVLRGLGGIGKTQIALEAAYQVRDAYAECSVFWIPAIDATTFENAYRRIGQELGLPGMDGDMAGIKALVKAALSRSGDDWLLIVDNADDVELLFGDFSLYDYLPSSHKGSILFTTRTHEVVRKLDIPRTNVFCVSEMTRSEATELMQKNLGSEQMRDSQSTTELLDFLADLPLAVKQASAYMDRTGITTTRYLEHCRSSDATFAKLLSKDFEDRGRYKIIQNTQNPVATTWLISFRQLPPLAARYLKYMSFLSEKDIPISLLADDDEDELERDEAIGTLRAYAFVTPRASHESYDMHRLVQLATRNWLNQEGQFNISATTVIRQLGLLFPFPEHENREIWVRYLPHAMTALEYRIASPDDVLYSTLLAYVAESNFMMGRYQNAEALYRKMLALTRQALGLAHPDTLISMNNLAGSLRSQGKYEEAEIMHRETLALRRQLVGDAHPDTLYSMNNLARVLQSQGKHEAAEAMHRETLALMRQVLGDTHPDTLISMSNLAESLRGQGEYETAEAMHRETLALTRQVLGKAHPSTLTSMNNLASVIRNQGKYEEAEAMFRETLAMMRLVLGDTHPDTLTVTNNLAGLSRSQGKYDEAETMYRETLAQRRLVLGETHPDTLSSMNRLASMLQSLGTHEAEADEALHLNAGTS